MQQNYINEQILHTINRILPIYANAKFTEEADRVVVKSLLVAHLKRTLPVKKEHQPYLGEWKMVPWEDSDLEAAFSQKLEWPDQQTMEAQRFEMDVPGSIEEAVRRQYKIKRETVDHRLKQWMASQVGSARNDRKPEG
jgi:hypothetical protein